MADKLWPRLCRFLDGTKAAISFGSGRYRVPYETLLLLVLFRFARPHRISHEMAEFFDMKKSKISAGIRTMVDAIHDLSFAYLDNPVIHRNRMPYCAAKIHEKCGLVETVWGFIDGTLRKTCRPTYFQKQAYSGHKRAHGIKFQSVVTPDGLFACMYGPVMGNRHHGFMLTKSRILRKLEAFMPPQQQPPLAGEDANNHHIIYSLYGDPAYPQSHYLFGGYRNPRAGFPQVQWNTKMSKVREVVELGFANILANWAFWILGQQ